MGERPSSSRECICPGLVERWANPPFSQVARMLDKIVQDQAPCRPLLSTASSLPVARGLAHWPNSIREANSIIKDKTGNLVNIMSEVALAAAMESMIK